MQAPNKNGELCVAICPDCGQYSIIDPAWLCAVGETVLFHCGNCPIEDEMKDHLIVKFIRSPENK